MCSRRMPSTQMRVLVRALFPVSNQHLFLCWAGIPLSSGIYSCYEAVLAFDIPGNVPAGATITGIELRLSLVYASSQDFTCEARAHPWTAGGLTAADWVAGSDLASKTLLATLDTNGIGATGEYKSFVSTAALNGWDRANVLEMVVASSRTRTGDAPAGSEWVSFRSADYSRHPCATHHRHLHAAQHCARSIAQDAAG